MSGNISSSVSSGSSTSESDDSVAVHCSYSVDQITSHSDSEDQSNQSAGSSNEESSHEAEAENLDDYNCPICMDPLVDTIVTNCGHRFCTYCLANWFHQRGRRNCPTCRSAIFVLNSLPTVSATVERLIRQNYTAAQKFEREEVRRARGSSELMQRLGPDPVTALISQPLPDSHLEFELPIFDFEDDDILPEMISLLDNSFPIGQLDPTHIINLTATTTFNLTEELPLQWGFQEPLPLPLELDPSDTRFMEVESLLDDFEIRLRQSQMAYRTLMDRLTLLDPRGMYFRRIDDRFRSLGLVAEGGRLVTSFPAQNAGAESNHTNVERDGSQFAYNFSNEYQQRQRQRTTAYENIRMPHPSDWFFINRIRTPYFRTAHGSRSWDDYFNSDLNTFPGTYMSHHSTSIEHPQPDDPSSWYLGQETRVTENYQNPSVYSHTSSLPEESTERSRNRNSYSDSSISHGQSPGFPLFQSSLYDEYSPENSVRGPPYVFTEEMMASNHEQQSYEFHGEGAYEYRTNDSSNASNVCVIHSDGSETWVDVHHDGSLNQDDFSNYQQMSQEMGRLRVCAAVAAAANASSSDGEGEQNHDIEYILEHHCHNSTQGHGGHLNYPGDETH